MRGGRLIEVTKNSLYSVIYFTVLIMQGIPLTVIFQKASQLNEIEKWSPNAGVSYVNDPQMQVVR